MNTHMFSRRQFLATSAAACAVAGTTRHVQAADNPSFPIRECYCPAHFGNAYEAMWPREMAAYINELKWMGFNRYGDWMVTTDVRDPYLNDVTWHLGKEQFDRKKKAFKAAQDAGMALNLIVTPNHVYLDQLKPELEAKKSQKIFGQLICPSHPEARKIILNNFERWFNDLADAGLRFNAFTAFAYDYGGCDCEKCRPWILTFAKVMKEIHSIALKRHPQIEPWFCSWWWTPEEHAQFNAWAASEAPGWLRGMTMHIEYGQTRPKDVQVPAGCRKLAFVHTGYSDVRDIDIYGHLGPVVAPNRIPKTLTELKAMGHEGYQAYSEGIFDDANKMLLAGIGSGQYRDASEALEAYAARYYGAAGEKMADWAKWIAQWGNRKSVSPADAAAAWEPLSKGAKPGWRLTHWKFKLELEQLDRSIGNPKEKEWTPEKLSLADKYFATQEKMYREAYRLGPLRHVIHPRFMPPTWQATWSKVTRAGAKSGVILPEQ